MVQKAHIQRKLTNLRHFVNSILQFRKQRYYESVLPFVENVSQRLGRAEQEKRELLAVQGNSSTPIASVAGLPMYSWSPWRIAPVVA